MPRIGVLFLTAAMHIAGGAPLVATALQAGVQAPTPTCDMSPATGWLQKWMSAWELASIQILRLPDAEPPLVLFYDDHCVYTTSPVSVTGKIVSGPSLRGASLAWRTAVHGGTLILPDGKKSPVQLMSFTAGSKATGPYFVMAAPDYWAGKRIVTRAEALDGEPRAVFLHEFAHTRQLPFIGSAIRAIEAQWTFPKELDDDAVQDHFESDADYVAAYRAERDLMYRAAAAPTLDQVRDLGRQALELSRRRRARWFTGKNALFNEVDSVFLSLEGAAQWTGYAWLSHGLGGHMPADAAAKKIAQGPKWVQDHGLALFLIVDRLLPDWPSRVFAGKSVGAYELLEQAVR